MIVGPRRCSSPHPPLVVAGCVLALCAGCSETPAERIDAIYDLRERPDADSVRRIRDRLADGDADVRATAINVLVQLEVADAPRIALDGLSDEDGFVRATAAKLLGDLGQAESVAPLVDVLTGDVDPVTRQRAAEALASLAGPQALAGLRRALVDPMDNVRLAAVRGLRQLDPASATAELSRLLLEDPFWEVRVQAAMALARTGDPAVVPVLEAGLEDENEFVRSASANALRVREAVAGGADPDDGPDPPR